MQTPPMKPPLRVVGVHGVPRVPGTYFPSIMGRAPSIGALPSDGFSLPASLLLGPIVHEVPFAGRGCGAVVVSRLEVEQAVVRQVWTVDLLGFLHWIPTSGEVGR